MKTQMKAVGYRILVKPDPVEEESKGGIILAMDKRVAAASQMYGTVLDIGPTAWNRHKGGEEWCQVGDRIAWSQYANREIQDPQDEAETVNVVINDEDVICVIEEI